VGGTLAYRNVITGNNGPGILIDGGASGNRIASNYIGTDVSGSGRLGNNG
jgi:titin